MLNNLNVGGQGTPNTNTSWTQVDVETAVAALNAAGFSAEAAELLNSSISQSQQSTETYRTPLPNQPSLPPPPSGQEPAVGYQGLRQAFNFEQWVSGMVEQMRSTPTDAYTDAFLQNSTRQPPAEVVARAEALGIPVATLFMSIEKEGIMSFNQQLMNLPPAEANRLMVAFYEPWAADELSPHLSAMYNQMKSNVSQMVAQNYGITMDWSGLIDDSYLQQQITNAYDHAFENALSEAVNQGRVSAEDAKSLRLLHYNSDAAPSVPPNLTTQFNALEESVKQQIQQEYGLKTTEDLHSDSQYFSRVLNGAYAAAFINALNNHTPPLTAAQKALILQAFSNPGSASDEIQQLIAELKSKSIANVVATYGLNSDWQPTITTLSPPGTDLSLILKAQAALNSIQERIGIANDALGNLSNPTTPQVVFLNFLQVVGEAINKMQDQIYSMQASQSEIEKLMSRMKLDMQLNSVKRQEDAAKKVEEKEGKMGNLGGLGKFLDVVMKVVLVAACLMAGGPAAIGIALALTIMFMVKPDIQEGAMRGITGLMQKAFGDRAGLIIGALVNIYVATALAGGNPMLLFSLLCDKSGPIQTFVAGCGGDAATQAIAAAVVQGVATVVVAAALMIATGGASAPALLEAVASFLNVSIESAMLVSKIALVGFQVAIAAMTITRQGVELNNNLLMAQIVMIKAKMEAQAQEIEAIIQVISQLITKLLEILNSHADVLVELGEFQGSKYSQASQLTTEIFS